MRVGNADQRKVVALHAKAHGRISLCILKIQSKAKSIDRKSKFQLLRHVYNVITDVRAGELKTNAI